MRQSAGYTQHALAPVVAYARSTIANVETGYQQPDRRFWVRSDEVLAAEGFLVAEYDRITALARRRRREQATASHLPARVHGVPLPPGPPAGAGSDEPEPDAADGSGYRDPSPLDGLAALSIETPVPTSIGWADVEHIRYITRALALSENQYGGGFSGQAAATQLRHSAQFIQARAQKKVRRAVYEAVGNLSGVVGFSAFDVADYRAARLCFDFALWCAEEAASWPLRATTLGDKARMAMYLGGHDNALSLIEHAQVRSDRISATTRAMLSAVRARLLALQGRHTEASSEVVRSDEYFFDRNPADDPPWITYYDEAEHQGSTGRALLPIALRTRDLATAVPRLQKAIRLHDADHPRSRAFSRTRLASLVMKIGDPKEAAAIGRTVLVEASALRSARLRAEIESLASIAADHDKIPEVAELRHEIAVSTRRVGVY